MDRIAAFYEAHHLLVLIGMVLFMSIYIVKIKNKKNVITSSERKNKNINDTKKRKTVVVDKNVAPKPNNKPKEIMNQTKSTKNRTFEYNSTRFTFRRRTIEQMNDEDVLIINVTGAININNEGVFKMTKKQIYDTYLNVINSVSYQEGGNYNYQITPQSANKFRR